MGRQASRGRPVRDAEATIGALAPLRDSHPPIATPVMRTPTSYGRIGRSTRRGRTPSPKPWTLRFASCPRRASCATRRRRRGGQKMAVLKHWTDGLVGDVETVNEGRRIAEPGSERLGVLRPGVLAPRGRSSPRSGADGAYSLNRDHGATGDRPSLRAGVHARDSRLNDRVAAGLTGVKAPPILLKFRPARAEAQNLRKSLDPKSAYIRDGLQVLWLTSRCSGSSIELA